MNHPNDSVVQPEKQSESHIKSGMLRNSLHTSLADITELQVYEFWVCVRKLILSRILWLFLRLELFSFPIL